MELSEELSPQNVINHSFYFSGLPPETTEKLAQITFVKKAPKGGVIFSRGQKATGFYLLAKGLVRIFMLDPNGRERIIKIIYPGEIFGEAAIFHDEGYPCNAMALTQVIVFFWPQKELLELLRSDGDFSMAMLGVMAQKLRHFTSLISLSLKEVLPKVADYLLRQPMEGQKLQLPPSKAVMASSLGMTAESFSRALSQLKKAHLIEEKPDLTIIDRAGLKLVAAGDTLKPGPDEDDRSTQSH
ncbi:MAG: Crp/Fnr family transcriptional regulator [Deltaproteobacteria bacterium]|jgi:CRP/FNR family transcriptional regulator|nr:Crp/Fnr family transcriptional regulator [Deltaproteobacteria bacterium]